MKQKVLRIIHHRNLICPEIDPDENSWRGADHSEFTSAFVVFYKFPGANPTIFLILQLQRQRCCGLERFPK
jgi:hypothetical protein